MDNALDSDSKDCRFDPGRAGQHGFAAGNNPPLAVRPITLCRRGRQFLLRKNRVIGHVLRLRGVCAEIIFFIAVSEIKNPFSQEDGFLICITHLKIVKYSIPIPL